MILPRRQATSGTNNYKKSARTNTAMENRISSVSAQIHGNEGPRLPLTGQLLVSVNRPDDSPLAGAVCLVLHHATEGSMGLILNRELDRDVESLWKVLKAPARSTAGPIRFGGPCSGPIIALHSHEQFAEGLAGQGVYLAAHLDKLQKLVATERGQVRIVVGQIQWNAGELESEVLKGQWLPMPATPELVFAPEDEMWGRGMRQAGNRFISIVSGAVPVNNPQLN